MLHMVVFFLAGLISASEALAQSRVFIDVGEARVRRSLLALPPIRYMGSDDSATNLKVGQDLTSVVNNNLDATGLFTFIKPDAYLEDVNEVGLRPAPGTPGGFNFNNWKTIGTEFLVRGGYTVTNNRVSLEIYTYYVNQGNLIFGKKYEGPVSSVRKMAHTFSEDFIKAVTNRESFFLHPIVASIDNGPKTHREIYTMDWDGENRKKITSHNSISISPTWSSDGKLIAYTSYVTRRVGKGPAKKNPDLYMFEVDTGRRWLVSYRDGINSGAAFLRNSTELLLNLTIDQTANIYRMDIRGRNPRQLTRGPGQAMNVEPAVSPDGTKIAFSSDRSGQPMIYIMDIDGSNVERITFAGNYNATPSWSPDGKHIAFAGYDRGRSNFDIFVIGADKKGLRRLTTAKRPNGRYADNEDPAFSPDGRHILFVSDRTGNKQLYMIGMDGTNERRITYDSLHYSKPKWGPRTE